MVVSIVKVSGSCGFVAMLITAHILMCPDQHPGKRVGIRIDGKDNYQLDGDVVGESTTLTAEIQPGALTVCAPAPVPGTQH